MNVTAAKSKATTDLEYIIKDKQCSAQYETDHDKITLECPNCLTLKLNLHDLRKKNISSRADYNRIKKNNN